MGCTLNGDSTIDVSVNDPKRTDKMGIELACGFVVKDQAFVFPFLPCLTLSIPLEPFRQVPVVK
jgi:hypothetical protein